ncbi:Mth938-like domain-containing protein [Malikia sp.]|uniref:Mth938-like domain-containing protein n=1 Tax=Malikia sp. TaxID=2070706 RepID=UPI00260A542A|nr:Mth938-like domain-containing protein [Malikia sp.]MDD2728575.1 Mth938-like domain-containing protein [Malikia sp.]
MKLQPDRFDTLFINAYAEDWIAVSGEKKHHSVVVSSQGQCSDWSCRSFAELSQDHFDRLAADRPEVVIFGSGAKLRFVSPALLRGLIERGIGVETMDTAAACRTYNILAQEGRRVVGALLLASA